MKLNGLLLEDSDFATELEVTIPDMDFLTAEDAEIAEAALENLLRPLRFMKRLG